MRSKRNMNRKYLLIVLLCCLLCCCLGNNVGNNTKVEKLKVSLPFKYFPKKYTCMGENISPPVKIEGVSGKAKSLVLIMIDLDAPKGIFVHWVAWNIPANVSYIPPGIPKKGIVRKPINLIQGVNNFGFVGYGGPCPPSGVHRYVIKVYALDCWLNLKPGSSLNSVYKAMNGHVLQEGSYTALCRAENSSSSCI